MSVVGWRRPDIGATVALLVAAAYVGVSFGVHHLFPFFVFDMYTHVSDRSSRLLGKEADGTVHDVSWYARWDCPPSLDIVSNSAPCGEGRVSHARDLEASDALRHGATSLPDGPAVTLIRRVVRVDGATPPDSTASDCVIAHCRAAR